MTASTNPQTRLHALDAVRAAALLLGIVLHATLSFIPGVGEQPQMWPVADDQSSPVAAILMAVIHVFRMPVFFLVAGFFAQQMLTRKGTRAFCHDRARRILAPLVVGWVLCLVIMVLIVTWAVMRRHGGTLPDPLPPFMQNSRFNLLHLWFLYLLLWLYGLSLVTRAVWQGVGGDGRTLDSVLARVLRSPAGALVLAAPIALALYLTPDWLVLLGVPTPGFTLIPPPGPLFIYAYVFGIGWALSRQRLLLDVLARRWWPHLLLSMLAVVVVLASTLTHPHVFEPVTDPGARGGYALAYAIGLVAGTFAFVGAGLRFCARSSATVRYLADASYWVYIVHLPLVLALQAALMLAPWHWALKFALINGLAAALLLASYQVAVRHTWVGRWLNGKRVVPVATAAPAPTAAAHTEPSSAAP